MGLHVGCPGARQRSLVTRDSWMVSWWVWGPRPSLCTRGFWETRWQVGAEGQGAAEGWQPSLAQPPPGCPGPLPSPPTPLLTPQKTRRGGTAVAVSWGCWDWGRWVVRGVQGPEGRQLGPEQWLLKGLA